MVCIITLIVVIFLIVRVLARFADFKSLKIDGNMIVSKGLDELKRILNDKLEGRWFINYAIFIYNKFYEFIYGW